MNLSAKKIVLCMIFMAGLLVLNLASVHAQNISLTKSEFTLNDLFSEIRKQSGYDFVFTTPQFNTAKKITVKSKTAALRDLLDQVFDGQQISYVIRNKTIVITDNKTKGQDFIQGFVGDKANRKAIPMVTVVIKGTQSAVQTNKEGRFSISVPPGAKSLEFRYLGYKTAEVPIKPNADYTIWLEEDQQVLNETVITGIVERRAESFTGSARTISQEQLKTISSNNVFAAITAYEPSFRVIANNVLGGNINQLPEVQLRGANSLPNLSGELSANPNLPLFILDGFEVALQRIVDLDMNLINSITLLKDASATAIYGSRGANGVMVVTTLVPKPGKIQVTLNNDFRFTTPDLSVYDLLNPVEKLDFEQRAGVYTFPDNQLFQYIADVQYNSRLKAVQSGVNTDWKGIPVQKSLNNRTSLYFQGGDEAIRYGLQVAADLQNGVMKGQDRTNYSGQFDLSYLVKKFRFSNSVRIFQNRSNESPYGDFSKYLNMNPYWSPFDASGNIQLNVEDFTVLSNRRFIANPLYDASLHSINRQKYFGFTNNFTARYNVLSNFFIESNFSINRQQGSADQFYSAADSRFNGITDASLKGSYTVRDDESSGFESLTTLNYNLLAGKHRLFNTLGFNVASSVNTYYSIVTQGFPYDRLDNLLFATGYPAGSRPTGEESTVRRLGMLYTGNYSYDDRFLADISVRRDGSSQFGTKERFGNFWSTGIGWNIHNEAFLKKNKVVNQLRLRGSYGSTGSLNIPAYSAQSRYSFGVSNMYYNDLGAVLSGLGNENLQWQNVYKLNIGLNAVLFNEKLDIRADIYKENTKNTLTQVTLAPSAGFANYNENLGEVENKGLEFGLRYKLMQDNAKGLLWSVNANGFTNNNILKKISNKLRAVNDKLDASSTQVRPNVLLREGESMNTIYAVRSLGVDPVTGSEIYLTKDGTPTYVWSAADKVALGISQPKWSGNFGTNFTYSGFDLNLLFNYQFGGQLYNSTLAERVESVNPIYNVDRRAYDLGWTKPGDQSQYTRIMLSKPATKLTSRFVQDDNNLVLSSASLGYNFYRNAFLKKIKLNSLQLRVISNDLFRVSSIQIERGTSNPFARTYSLSIRAGF